MSLENPWVGYIDRSYKQIKNSVLNRLGAKVPELTDYSESNPLIVILGIFAGVAEMLNYYIDNMARESFISTCRRYSSAVKLVRLIDYRVKSSIPSAADLTLTLDTLFLQNADIPVGTIFQTANGIQFINPDAVTVPNDSLTFTVPVLQQEIQEDVDLGLTTGVIDQIISLTTQYVHNSLSLTIGGEIWELKDTLAFSEPTDKHFIVEVSTAKVPFIKFGDNINGAIPTGGQAILGDYLITQGSAGNVDANTITEIVSNLTLNGVNEITVTNILASVAGTDVESLERIKRSAPLSLRTVNRAVTQDDYVDIALLAPGVDKANIRYECNKTVDLYISPNGGGVASQAFLDTVDDYFDDKRMVTTQVRSIAAGESYLYLNIAAKARFRVNKVLAESEIREALINAYNYEASSVNRDIRVSDVTAIVDNLNTVDYANIIDMYIKPYARPRNHINSIEWDFIIFNQEEQEVNWRLDFSGNSFRLFKEGLFVMNIPKGITLTTPDDNYRIWIRNSGTQAVGNIWDFKSYNSRVDQVVTDLSVPVLLDKNLKISVTEKVVNNAN